MQFSMKCSLEILERTPLVLKALLNGLSTEWTLSNEGPDTWSAFDIVGHLIHGERTDWLERRDIILSDSAERTFRPFDRTAMFTESQGKNLGQLLEEFETLRARNLQALRARDITASDLTRTGIHPALGEVTLKNLLTTWAVHDLNHLHQISRVMARQYASEVGPWVNYLGVLRCR